MPRFIDDELNSHLEELADELVAQGLSAEAARTEATHQFGDMAEIRWAMLGLHPVRRWPWFGAVAISYLLLGELLYLSSRFLGLGGRLSLWHERLLVGWWSWLALGVIMLLVIGMIQFYGLVNKITAVRVLAFTLLCGLVATIILDVDNFEVNLHALAGAIMFGLLLMLGWSRFNIRTRRGLLLGSVVVLSWNILHQKLLFGAFVQNACLYLTPDNVPLTGILEQCRQLSWINPMLWPLYAVLSIGGLWFIWYVISLWRNHGTYWYRKVFATAALVAMPVLPYMENNLNNRGELDVIPWKTEIYQAYIDILGRAPEAKDFEFYANTRAYMHMSRIRKVLYKSDERRIKVRLLYKHIMGEKPTRAEVREYAKSVMTIAEIEAELRERAAATPSTTDQPLLQPAQP